MIETYGDKVNGKIVTVIAREEGCMTEICIEYENGRLTKISRRVLNSSFEPVEERIKTVHADRVGGGVPFCAQKQKSIPIGDVLAALEAGRNMHANPTDDLIYEIFFESCKNLERKSGAKSMIWSNFIDIFVWMDADLQTIANTLRAAGFSLEE